MKNCVFLLFNISMLAPKNKIFITPFPPCLRSGFTMKISNCSISFILRELNFLKFFSQNCVSSTFPCLNLTFVILKSQKRTFAILKRLTNNMVNCLLLLSHSFHFLSKNLNLTFLWLKSHKQNIHYVSYHGCEVYHDYNKSETVHFMFHGKQPSIYSFSQNYVTLTFLYLDLTYLVIKF